MRLVDFELSNGLMRAVNVDLVQFTRERQDKLICLVFGTAHAGGYHELAVKGSADEVRAKLEGPAAPEILPSAGTAPTAPASPTARAPRAPRRRAERALA